MRCIHRRIGCGIAAGEPVRLERDPSAAGEEETEGE
jgi:hypothetical protein